MLSVSENLIPSLQRVIMVDLVPVGPEDAACPVPSSAYASDASQRLYAFRSVHEAVEVGGTKMCWQRGVSSMPGGGHACVCQKTSDTIVGGLIGELEEVCVLVE